MHAAIDHLVVTAPSLEAGAGYVRRELGVEMHPGGEHASMGTHNLLLQLGELTYLEVIAVNPRATAPTRPRWFGLDHVTPQARPRLAAWVARVDDIHAAVASSPLEFGEIVRMQRGPFDWLIAIPANGAIPNDGLWPLLIQWAGPHPASMLPESGCRLERLDGLTPATRARLGFEMPDARCVDATGAGLRALIRTPSGAGILSC